MDSIPLHPKLVHLPIALAVLLPALAAALWLAIGRGWLPPKAWLLAAIGQLLLFGSGFAASSSGEADEERVEAFVPEAALEAHEHAAESFLWAAGVVALVMVVPLLLRGRARRIGELVAVAGTFLVLYLGYQVGQAGGELVYRHGAAQAHAATSNTLPAARRDDDDDR